MKLIVDPKFDFFLLTKREKRCEKYNDKTSVNQSHVCCIVGNFSLQKKT